jgi:endoglucanase
LNNASDPYYVNVQAGTYTIPSYQPCDDALPCNDSGLSKGAIAGIVIGVILGIALIIALICYWKRDRISAWWDKGYRGPKR